MYTVMGVTGKVGGATARALLAQGKRPRGVVRHRAKGESWAAQGCEVAIADLDDAEALGRAFEGAEAAFVMLPPLFDPSPDWREARAMIDTLRAALTRGAPKRVVALSTIGADAQRPNLLSQLGLLERALSTLALPVTFLRAAWFMENAAIDLASARDHGVITSYLQPLDRAVPMIATADIGNAIADLLQQQWSGTRIVELEAAGRVSPAAIAAAFFRALGKPVRAEAVPREQWEAIFREQGMHNPLPRMQMIDGFNQGWIDFADKGANARKGSVSIEAAIAALVESNTSA
ncbi:NmrA family NAD(P)-binding protein [Bradyrhizobium sp. Arg237L]|uniref:NmrA family NAD(P)-binding protein n=1 Tax=Bradyrhizobium sp. Arg237L TaxID=3003352 RepID=UPI00249E1A53|nr:NmrA family NAD(P)-binding protein [Bradyrhizobium sp. Arg237L]MDI4236680.1 NmrA family NAD(P)-binding protein [Bradyrhizobium sp. Arg237L]